MAREGPPILKSRRGRGWTFAERPSPYGNEYIVDASVVVKWYVDEEHCREARILRDRLADGGVRMHAPELLLLEVANAFRFNREAVRDLTLARIERLNTFGIIFHGVETAVLRDAIDLSFGRSITIYDAVYAALALTLRVPLVTADGVLLRKLDGTGLAIPLAGIS